MAATYAGTPPALIGDGQGRFKIWIVGNSGTGKTTLGRTLAGILDVPHISLDMLYWQPNWKETPVVEFRAKVADAIRENAGGWVVDGEYGTRLGNVVRDAASDVIWLDPPLLLYFPRIVVRTLLGLLHIRQPCSPGCYETVQSVFFSKQSILWWCVSHHSKCRKEGWMGMRENGVRVEEDGRVLGNMRRMGGWGGELRRWLEDVRGMVSGRSTAK